MERYLFDFLKGIWIGGTLTVPGVSGGTMAMVLGVYERLVRSVNSLVKGLERGKSIRFLLVFCTGGLLGVFALSGVVSRLLVRFPAEMIFFFTGAVAGGVPAILGEMKRAVFKWHQLLYLFCGAGTVFFITLIPEGFFSLSADHGIFLKIFSGMIAAVALVLPGISVSHMLYVLGIYESLMTSIYKFELLLILPFGLGVVIGIILTARAVEALLQRFKVQTYLTILGFVLSSVFEMLFSVQITKISLLYPLLLAAGYLPIYLLFRYNKAGA